MYRTLVILRHSFIEAVLQPIYALMIGLGAALLIVFGLLPFFTLGEDTVMYKAVGLDFILILVLIATLFATSKSVFDEIEDRTMLTLMSKPVQRWQVLVGKYLGIILAALVAIALLGGVMALCVYGRIPNDYTLKAVSIDKRELDQLISYRQMHLAGLAPALLQVWMEISVLAAISVALSTRVALVVNLPVVVLIYLAGNLTRFLHPVFGPESPLVNRGMFVRGAAWLVTVLLPSLDVFDLKSLTVYSHLRIGKLFEYDPQAIAVGKIWGYLGLSLLYAIAYAAFALAIGMWSFQTRELGGAEG